MTENPTIHVIDDDDAVRDSLGLMLEAVGFAVCRYPSAAAFFREAELDDNCCLLVDLHMPGMNGLDLLGRLRCGDRRIPAILMTGRADAALRRTLGPVMLLEKPFRLCELTDRITAVIGANGP